MNLSHPKAELTPTLTNDGPTEMTEKKFNVILCGIAKDEERNIHEWVAYHLAIGFDHIILYDNDSAIPISSMFSDSVKSNRLTIIPWPKKEGENAQATAYEHFRVTFRTKATWAAVLDLDELINLKIDSSIQDFVARFSDATCIAINWRIFGSAGADKYMSGTMMERFQRASSIEFAPNRIIKTIYRLDKVQSIYQHHGIYYSTPRAYGASGRVVESNHYLIQDPTDFYVAQINHYFVKSKEEWSLKNARGYTDQTVRSANMFEEYDQNEVEDLSITRHLNLTYEIINKIKSDGPK